MKTVSLTLNRFSDINVYRFPYDRKEFEMGMNESTDSSETEEVQPEKLKFPWVPFILILVLPIIAMLLTLAFFGDQI